MSKTARLLDTTSRDKWENRLGSDLNSLHVCVEQSKYDLTLNIQTVKELKLIIKDDAITCWLDDCSAKYWPHN